MCLSYFELEDGAFHAVACNRQLIGSLLVAALIVEQQEERSEDREDR